MKLLIVLIFILFPLLVNSKSDEALVNNSMDTVSPISVPDQPVATANTLDLTQVNSHQSGFMPSIIVLFLGALAIALEVYLASIDVILSEKVFKWIIVTLVITGTMLLITVFHANKQVTWLTGIFGIIIVYLLLKADFSNDCTVNLVNHKKSG